MRVRSRVATLFALYYGAQLLAACGGDSRTEPPVDSEFAADDAATPVEPDEPTVGVVQACDSTSRLPLRRLTNVEYRNTLTDLIGDRVYVDEVTAGFAREPTALGFRNQASSLQVDDLIAEQFQAAAIKFAARIVADHFTGPSSPCELQAVTPACVQQFVIDYGARVYRRPLEHGELVRFSELYDRVLEQGGDRQAALEWVVASMLSSTYFLFRVEADSGDAPRDHQVASRLSYLLWQTMPDAELFAAAADGRLQTRTQVREQVRRMVHDPKAARVFEFFEQWLDVDELGELQRSEDVYPQYNTHLRDLLYAESKAFITHLLTGGGTFTELLTAEYTFANRALAEHYGLTPLPAGDAFERIEAKGRSGILTQAPLLIHDHPYRTSVVRRGLAIRTGLLCQLIPAPPDSVDLSLPELDGELSQRERLAQHVSDPSCSGCHTLLDPIGLVFEGFDALGRQRSTDEGGAPVTPSGALVGTRDADGDYSSVRELGSALAESEEVRQCFVRQAFRFFYGRDTTPDDECALRQISAAFGQHDFRLSDLIFGLVDTDLFLNASPADVTERTAGEDSP